MKKVIYYFSGTGNSLRAAKVIAQKLGDTQIISVRCDPQTVSAEEADIIGFVCPVYEWDIPGAMKTFVANLKINPKAYIFMVATYILIHGKSFETMEELLSSKGAHLSYSRPLRCVASQCIAYPPFPPEKLMIPIMEKTWKKSVRKSKTKNKGHFPVCPLLQKNYIQKS